MNPHRRHYFDLNPPPFSALPAVAARLRIGALPAWLLVALLALVLAAIQVVVLHRAEPAVVVTPIREPEILHYPLQWMEDARSEGFRAGVRAATEGGCVPRLSAPLTTR